ncbi:hypothetical protein MIND_00399800 [Mycena indigotica]|uniref:Uncharacterized protein n=1 Tax=Mycena indigotica TaxID=2126181 RepID=A0A8H6W928_9AGAR|nr:uncharacterized protein MIND_00399800 [Mycena indigotica]KAF7310259.1 hypothetical protein MIND_00399800 [Mycena indigotica]
MAFSPGLFILLCFIIFPFAISAPSPASTSITLWQFGQPRLLNAPLGTLPLIPLGSEGGATTYLYQALVPATPTDDPRVIATSTVARTIIASASGWVEPFDNGNNIACHLINPTFGACVEGTASQTANMGTPTPEVLQVALDALPAAQSFLPNPSTSLPQSTQAAAGLPLPAIVGAVVGAVLLIAIVAGACFILSRRRRKQRSIEDGMAPRHFLAPPTAYPSAPKMSYSYTPYTPNAHRRGLTIDTSVSTLVSSTPSMSQKSNHLGDVGYQQRLDPPAPSVHASSAASVLTNPYPESALTNPYAESVLTNPHSPVPSMYPELSGALGPYGHLSPPGHWRAGVGGEESRVPAHPGVAGRAIASSSSVVVDNAPLPTSSSGSFARVMYDDNGEDRADDAPPPMYSGPSSSKIVVTGDVKTTRE